MLNPRRKSFDVDDPSTAETQIAWEHVHLRRATTILYWFPEEQVQPSVQPWR